MAALLAQVAASSPTPTPDLGSALAPAPGADWIETGATPKILDGPFTAEQYAAYLQALNATPNTIATELTSTGFVAGYAREWVQRGTQDILIERVFQFDAATGAGFWYHQLRLQNLTSKYFERSITGLDSIPQGFGVVLKAPNGDREYRVEFTKGNAVLVVHMIASTNDLESATVKQALAQYQAAPATSPRAAARAVGAPTWLLAAAVGTLLLLLAVTAATVLLVVMVSRRRPALRPAVAVTGVQISPDGAYWWDGARWRDASAEVPPGAQRSADGFYWWDGKAWRTTSR